MRKLYHPRATLSVLLWMLLSLSLPNYVLGSKKTLSTAVNSPTILTYHNRILHLFGDPSMVFHTAVPVPFKNIDVDRSGGKIKVNTNGEPARISFYDMISNDSYQFWGTEASIEMTQTSQVFVCVTGQNKLTYLDGMANPIGDALKYVARGDLNAESETEAVGIDCLISPSAYEYTATDLAGRKLFEGKSTAIPEVEKTLRSKINFSGMVILSVKRDGKYITSKKIMIK